jgi:DNA repair protein RadA
MSEEEFPEEPLVRLKSLKDSPDLIKVLKDKGYYSIESLAVEAPSFLFEMVGPRPGFTIEKARQIVHEARDFLQIEILDAMQLYEIESKRKRYTTGSKKLDELLGGGIPEEELTEFTGEYESGKTEICMTTAILAATEGVNSWVLDTEGGFSGRRLAGMVKARGFDPSKVLPHIYYGAVYGTEHLLFLLQHAHKPIKEKNIKILIIDSFVSPFRAEYPGRELLYQRQPLINRCQRRLINYMRAYKLAVITTQQVMARPEAAPPYPVRPEILNPPIGGHTVSHAVSHRVYLEKPAQKTKKRLATLIASNYMPWATCEFQLTEAGVEDIPEPQPKEELSEEKK